MLEVHGNIVAADVRSHSNDGSGVVELADKVSGRDAI